MGWVGAAPVGPGWAPGGAATSLAAAKGYPWPVVKLACFGQRSWRELKATVTKLVPPPKRRGCRSKAKGVAVQPAAAGSRTTPARGPGLVGGGRARAKPSSWALAAEMERYVAAHNAPPNAKTVRTVRP